MAGRMFDWLQALGKKRVVIAGSFRPNGSSAVDNTLNTGLGFSVVRDDVGDFTITLEDRFNGIDSAQISLELAAPGDSNVNFGDIDVVTAGTLIVSIFTAAVTADLADDANNRVHFSLTLKNTNIRDQ